VQVKVTPAFLAIAMIFTFVGLHARFIPLMSGSLGEYWRRNDRMARWSKLLAFLSLVSSGLCFVSPYIAIAIWAAFSTGHGILAMNEFR